MEKRAKKEALKLTKEAETELSLAGNLLGSALGKSHGLDWKGSNTLIPSPNSSRHPQAAAFSNGAHKERQYLWGSTFHSTNWIS